MKHFLSLLLFLSFTPISHGSSNLLAFFRDHPIGSTLPGGKEGFNELPEREFSARQFSAYCDLDATESIVRAGLYLRRKTSDVPATDLQELFAEMKKEISAESGDAELFAVPNFEDATERTHVMSAWKDGDSILILQKFENPGRVEVDVRHVNIDSFISELGADFGGFVLPKLETKAGKLTLPQAAPQKPNQEAPKDDPASSPSQEGRPQSDSINSESRDFPLWAVIVGIMILLGVSVVLIGKTRRGNRA